MVLEVAHSKCTSTTRSPEMSLDNFFCKQVKPGFTNYLPRGLAQKINLFNQKFWKISQKSSKKFQNVKNILKNGENFKLLKIVQKILKIVIIFIQVQNKKEEYQKTLKTKVSMTQNP